MTHSNMVHRLLSKVVILMCVMRVFRAAPATRIDSIWPDNEPSPPVVDTNGGCSDRGLSDACSLLSNVCNTGTCKSKGCTYVCVCPDGYGGSFCETLLSSQQSNGNGNGHSNGNGNGHGNGNGNGKSKIIAAIDSLDFLDLALFSFTSKATTSATTTSQRPTTTTTVATTTTRATTTPVLTDATTTQALESTPADASTTVGIVPSNGTTPRVFTSTRLTSSSTISPPTSVMPTSITTTKDTDTSSTDSSTLDAMTRSVSNKESTIGSQAAFAADLVGHKATRGKSLTQRIAPSASTTTVHPTETVPPGVVSSTQRRESATTETVTSSPVRTPAAISSTNNVSNDASTVTTTAKTVSRIPTNDATVTTTSLPIESGTSSISPSSFPETTASTTNQLTLITVNESATNDTHFSADISATTTTDSIQISTQSSTSTKLTTNNDVSTNVKLDSASSQMSTNASSSSGTETSTASGLSSSVSSSSVISSGNTTNEKTLTSENVTTVVTNHSKTSATIGTSPNETDMLLEKTTTVTAMTTTINPTTTKTSTEATASGTGTTEMTSSKMKTVKHEVPLISKLSTGIQQQSRGTTHTSSRPTTAIMTTSSGNFVTTSSSVTTSSIQVKPKSTPTTSQTTTITSETVKPTAASSMSNPPTPATPATVKPRTTQQSPKATTTPSTYRQRATEISPSALSSVLGFQHAINNWSNRFLSTLPELVPTAMAGKLSAPMGLARTVFNRQINGSETSVPSSKGDNGHSSNGDNGHSSNGVNGHSSNGVNGHSSNGVNGHSSNGDNGHSSKGDNGHSSKGENGHSSKGDNGHSSKGDNGHSSKGDNGNSKVVDNRHTSVIAQNSTNNATDIVVAKGDNGTNLLTGGPSGPNGTDTDNGHTANGNGEKKLQSTIVNANNNGHSNNGNIGNNGQNGDGNNGKVIPSSFDQVFGQLIDTIEASSNFHLPVMTSGGMPLDLQSQPVPDPSASVFTLPFVNGGPAQNIGISAAVVGDSGTPGNGGPSGTKQNMDSREGTAPPLGAITRVDPLAGVFPDWLGLETQRDIRDLMQQSKSVTRELQDIVTLKKASEPKASGKDGKDINTDSKPRNISLEPESKNKTSEYSDDKKPESTGGSSKQEWSVQKERDSSKTIKKASEPKASGKDRNEQTTDSKPKHSSSEQEGKNKTSESSDDKKPESTGGSSRQEWSVQKGRDSSKKSDSSSEDAMKRKAEQAAQLEILGHQLRSLIRQASFMPQTQPGNDEKDVPDSSGGHTGESSINKHSDTSHQRKEKHNSRPVLHVSKDDHIHDSGGS